MDALSKILELINLKGVVYQKLGFTSPWGISIPQGQFALFRMVIDGRCLIKMEGEQAVEVKGGDLVLFPHSSSHWIGDQEHSRSVSATEFSKSIQNGKHLFSGDEETTVMISGHFEFDSRFRHPFIKSLPKLIHIKHVDAKELVWLQLTTDLIIEETSNEKIGTKILVSRLAEVLFIHTMRAYVQQSDNLKGYLSAFKDERINRALKLIHESPEKDWTLELLSKSIGMSRTLFCNRFKELVGETPLNYLTNWRILKAQQILTTSKENIVDVASKVGYQSEAAFNRVFKSRVNQTPANYRRQLNIHV